jgi:hypothetical protein
MADNKAFHAAIALIKVKGKVIGKIKNLRGNEQYNRIGVQGVGTIFESEAPVTKVQWHMLMQLIEIAFKGWWFTRRN